MEKKRKGAVISRLLLVSLVSLAAFGQVACNVSVGTLDLSADVNYRLGQFNITNNDSYGWYDVTLELNDEYTVHEDYIEPNSTYSVGALNFTKNDGTRFNPITQKALKLSISAENADGKKGHFLITFD